MNINEQIFQDFKAGRIDSLYTQEFPSLKAFAARYLTDNYAMMAEDCVQDAIVNTYQARHTFNSALQMKAFLYTCIRNACISILRKIDSQQNYLSEHEIDYEWEISAAIIEQETLDRLHSAIRSLPEKYRQIFNLDYEQGLHHAEIAKLLAITIDGVTKRKAKMISLLREKFKDEKQMLLFVTLMTI
jgi:RNA polymerase sigma-70 factor (ECF subfamily)